MKSRWSVKRDSNEEEFLVIVFALELSLDCMHLLPEESVIGSLILKTRFCGSLHP
ncbi:hypothetical protein A2U01_0012236, partial [Trifolium medium]|nr:hypothetical protein [Trifolium medium]